jgi:hypothetical protein
MPTASPSCSNATPGWPDQQHESGRAPSLELSPLRVEQRGFFTRQAIIRRLIRMRMAVYQGDTDAESSEAWERAFRRKQGLGC